jgi:small basic protein (TIGR04137 family)
MSIDKSLQIKAGSAKQRNVLRRAERLARLQQTDRWKEGDSVYGLPKVRVVKLTLKKKKKEKKAEEGAVAGAPAAEAPAAAKAPAGKAPGGKS